MKYIILYLLSQLYFCIITIYSALYKLKIFKAVNFSVPILAVGNISMGGTGKTPMVICLSKLLNNKNIKHVVVSRGYKKQSKGTVLVSNGIKPVSDFVENAYVCGDEAYLIAVKLPNTPVVVGENKINAIKFAIKKFKPNLILLDDAFQSLYLKIDYNIVLHNAAMNKKDQRMFPLGKLRQPLSQLSRADVVMQKNRDYNIQKTVLKWDHSKIKFIPDSSSPASDKAFVFCGLANPENFFQSASQLGIDVILEKSYADHFKYQNNTTFKKDCSLAKKLGARIFLTTYKDFVKLQNDSSFMNLDVKWKILDIEYCLPVSENTINNILLSLSIDQ